MKTNFNDFAIQLEELAEVTRGFEKDNYDMGWAFIKGALHAMSGMVDIKLEEFNNPMTLNICVQDNGADVDKIAKELCTKIHEKELRGL